ncbi:MAG: hypothetical protein ABIR06_01600 [Cyclobacteriaceae bacterium]
MLFNSSFILVFAMFEKAIQGICRHSLGTGFSLRRKDIIVSYKSDLEKAFDVKLDFGVWDEILLFREARNRLVHSSLQLMKQPESRMRQSLSDFLKNVGFVKYLVLRKY